MKKKKVGYAKWQSRAFILPNPRHLGFTVLSPTSHSTLRSVWTFNRLPKTKIGIPIFRCSRMRVGSILAKCQGGSISAKRSRVVRCPRSSPLMTQKYQRFLGILIIFMPIWIVILINGSILRLSRYAGTFECIVRLLVFTMICFFSYAVINKNRRNSQLKRL